MKSRTKWTVAIVVLSVLLAVSLVLLSVVSVNFFKLKHGYAVVPGNEVAKSSSYRMLLSAGIPYIVVQEGATKLELNRRNPDDSTAFDVGNMFPGDGYEKKYIINTSYVGNVTIRFNAEIRDGSEKLAEVLKTRVIVVENGVKYLLYDGLMGEMPEFLGYNVYSAIPITEEITYYICAYLDTSVGNEYQGKTLVADFSWWVPAEEIYIPIIPNPPIIPDDPTPDVPVVPIDPVDPIEPDEPIEPDTPDIPDDPLKPDDPNKPDEPGELVDPPGTSDRQVVLYIVAVVTVAVLTLLLIFKRRKEVDSYER